MLNNVKEKYEHDEKKDKKYPNKTSRDKILISEMEDTDWILQNKIQGNFKTQQGESPKCSMDGGEKQTEKK